VANSDGNQNNLISLMRLIRRSVKVNRFTLIFVNCSSLNDQNKYIIELQERCSNDDILLIDINLLGQLPISNLFLKIQNHLVKNFPKGLPSNLAIQVTGLEISILLDADEHFPTVLQTLNIGRERYRNELPYPLLIWLPDYAYVKLANVAPDFWSVREGSFTFRSNEIMDDSYDLERIVSERKGTTTWRDKMDQIPLIERILEWMEKPELNNNPKILADLYLKLGEAYRFIGKLDNAEKSFEKVRELNNQKIHDDEIEGIALNGLGLIYSARGEFIYAIQRFNNYINIRKRQGKLDAQAVGYNHLGFAYYKKKNFHEAIKCFNEALKINQNFGKRNAEGDVLGNLGLVYRELKDYEKAIQYHNDARQISRELSDKQSEVKDLGNIGLVYHAQGRYKEALKYYEQALQLSQLTGNRQDEMDQRLNLADAMRDLKEFERARENYIETEKVAKEIGNEKLQLTVLERMTDLYYPDKLNNAEQENLWLEKFIEQSEQFQNDEILLRTAKKIIEYSRREDLSAKKREWLLKAEVIVQRLVKKVENSVDQFTFCEMLIEIYKGLSENKKVKEYQKELEKLKKSRQIIIWLSPGVVKVEENNPILNAQQTYTFWVRIGSPVTKYSWIFNRDFDFIKLFQKGKTEKRDGFKVSSETVEKEKKGILEADFPSTHKDNKSVTLTEENKRKSGPTKLPKTKDEESLKYLDVKTPVPTDKISELIDKSLLLSTVTFKFQGENMYFNKNEEVLEILESGDTQTISFEVTPQKHGDNKITITLATEDLKYQDKFEILFQSKQKPERQIEIDGGIRNDFIRGNKKIKIISNGGEPFKIPKSWQPVLSRSDILVVIPDMHMYIYNSNLDNFKYGAEAMALEDKTLLIYQLGDLYEQRFPGLHSANATAVEIRMSHPDYDQIINMMNGMRTHSLYGNHDFELRHFPGFRFAAIEGKVYIEHGFTPDSWKDFSNPNAPLWEVGQFLFLTIREINEFFANLLVEAKFIEKDELYSWGVRSGKDPDYAYPSEDEYLRDYGHILKYYSERMAKNPENSDTKICVVGHTHHPYFKPDVNDGKHIFIDAGAWTSGRSDFAVITNEEVAICCYKR